MSAITFDPDSSWQANFSFNHVKCLIVCRGPIRLETMGVFEELGANFGMLLSEKDSIIYPQTLAPELRALSNRREQVHHVQDYMGATKEERVERIEQIISICHEHGYTHLFAGYGFMAEDAEFAARIENADISFVGPNSKVIQQAGSKDEAKELARSLKVSVTPGEDRIAAITLLKKAGDSPHEYFRKQINKHNLILPEDWKSLELLTQAITILQASYVKQVDLFTIPELQQETLHQVEKLWSENPGKRIRLKHVGGGGGKGQRVVTSVDEVPEAVMSVLIESKATGVGDNKNFLIELNIEDTRHNEIQLLGNGEWCIELGGRDCSLQMHEQKLLEVSLTEEMLADAAVEYEAAGKTKQAKGLRADGNAGRLASVQGRHGIAGAIPPGITFYARPGPRAGRSPPARWARGSPVRPPRRRRLPGRAAAPPPRPSIRLRLMTRSPTVATTRARRCTAASWSTPGAAPRPRPGPRRVPKSCAAG